MSNYNTINHNNLPLTPVAVVKELLETFTLVNSNLNVLQAYIAGDFARVQAKINLLHEQASNLVNMLAQLQVNYLPFSISTTIANSSLYRLSHLITYLQYQDILRQKLENLQKIATLVLVELESNKKQEVQAGQEKPHSLMGLHSEIALLFIVQLQDIGVLYKEVLAKIKDSLGAIKDNVEYLLTVFKTQKDIFPYLTATNIATFLSLEVTELINKIRSISQFDDTMNKLSNHLHQVLLTVNLWQDPAATDKREYTLTHLENLYTTQRERDIHQLVFNKKIAGSSNGQSQENIELF